MSILFQSACGPSQILKYITGELKKLAIFLDVTCGIIAAINDTRVFYFAMIIHNGSVKTEPIPLFQFLTDKPDEHSITSALS